MCVVVLERKRKEVMEGVIKSRGKRRRRRQTAIEGAIGGPKRSLLTYSNRCI